MGKAEQHTKALLQVSGLSKKFCKDLKHNMIYGLTDLTKAFLGISIERDTLRKKEFWAVKDVDLTVYENEITALLGINGSGKTSLIRMLAGIYETDRGEVTYCDTIQNIVSVFAIKSGLHATLTGRQNIYLKSAYYGSSRKMVDEKIEFIINFSGVREYIDSPLGTYSSGMKTRLAMSIALSIEADILYIDEGFSFSDPGFKLKCFDFLKTEYNTKGKALVFATHQMGKISELANRVILLEKGLVVLNTTDIELGLETYLEYCNNNQS